LGFERYWVNQALELTNHNKDYALEWLLSDEFKLARQQFNEQKKKFKEKQTPRDIAMPETTTKQADEQDANPLLEEYYHHSKQPSLQEASESKSKPQPQPRATQEVEVEYDPNAPDLKPRQTLTDFKKVGIDHLLQGDDDSDSMDNHRKKKKAAQKGKGADDEDDDEEDEDPVSQLLNPMASDMERMHSAQIEDADEPVENDEDMQDFLQKLKNQVNMKGDWLCHSCGVEVKGELTECHMCGSQRPGETDWICHICTFVNAEDDAVCQMCLSEKPNTNDLHSKEHRISLKAEQTWACASCGYHNTKTKCCRMCGYVLGDKVTPQQADSEKPPPSQQQDDDDGNVLLELARSDKPKVDIHANGTLSTNGNDIRSPSKHISANSGNDPFGDVVDSWEIPDAPKHEIKVKQEKANRNGNGGGGGMVMLERKAKRKKAAQDDEEDEEEEEEEEVEESSIEEVEDGVEVIAASNGVNKLADADDEIPAAFDIPEMDVEQLPEAQQSPLEHEEDAADKEKEKEKGAELSGIELLRSVYKNDEQEKQKQSNANSNTKIKLKLRVGTVVDIYSSTKQDWTEGIIKEIKGDLLCIVYGKHMKWLKKNSRQLRPKAQQVQAALQEQAASPSQSAVSSKNANALLDEHEQEAEHEPDDVPPAAFAEADEFQPPPPNDPPPAFAVNDHGDLLQPMKPDEFATPKVPRKGQEQLEVAQMESKPDEFDYDVTFTTSVLGLELYPDRDGKNCIVGKCLSKTSKKFVDPSSMIVAVNDMWVAGMSYDMVRDAIKQAAKYPPLKIQFRVKMNNIGKNKERAMNGKEAFNERGYLKVKVVAGVQLKHRASYCVVQVGNARLSTREVQRDEHPEWQEMLTFKNFRPDEGKKATVTVYDHSTILKDKKIGSAQYEIPTAFNKLQRDTLELKNNKGKLSGVIILNTIIVHKSNSIRHLRKY